MMDLYIHPSGITTCLYDEAISLSALGKLTIHRASHVEPDARGQWWADLAPSGGPRLGPFSTRSAALRAETAWLNDNVFLNR